MPSAATASPFAGGPADAARPQSSALTILDRVEQSRAVQLLDSRASALLELLPDAAAASRFRRITIQALSKNPDLLDCTPESVVLSVFEAAEQGLEPTGASGGAHLVPFNVKVSKNPDRYEKRAQLIPDYRGVVYLVTKPGSQVVAIEADVVKEGDEFSYTKGTDAVVNHVPSLLAGRSAKATTHVYAIARFANGTSTATVMDRADVERIRGRTKGEAFSPWATDWDEMAKKTVVKRLAKLLPVPKEVRSLLVREDELSGQYDEDLPVGSGKPTGSRRVDRLAQRLGAKAEEPAPVTPDPAVEGGTFEEIEGESTEVTAGPTLGDTLRATAAASELEGRAPQEAIDEVRATVFADWDRSLISDGIRVVFGQDAVKTPSAAQVEALKVAAQAIGQTAFLAGWRDEIARAAQVS